MLTASFLAQLHYGTNIFSGHHNLRIHHRLLHVVYLRRVGHIGRIGKLYHGTVALPYMVDYARSCCYKVKIIFSLQPLLDNLKMKKTKEAASESEAQGNRGLRLEEE